MNEYSDRKIRQQGNHYTKHIMAMTVEGLHDKSDIAAELAHRDILVEELTQQLAAALVDKDCWLTNAKNLQVGYNELDAKYRVLKSEFSAKDKLL